LMTVTPWSCSRSLGRGRRGDGPGSRGNRADRPGSGPGW
jgi:hypothetical protein